MPNSGTATAEKTDRAASSELAYPVGEWISQSTFHFDALHYTQAALKRHFPRREEALVSGEVLVYFEKGDIVACLKPDMIVALGLDGRRDRSSYKVWEEGKPPDFVLELASPGTSERYAGDKARSYSRIGVKEYWRLDPKGGLMAPPPIRGLRLYRRGMYGPVQQLRDARGVVHYRSEVLGVYLRAERRDGVNVMVVRDPKTGQDVPAGRAVDEELREARRLSRELPERLRELEEAKRAAEKRALEAEARLAELERNTTA